MFQHQDLQKVVSLTKQNMNNYHPSEVVGRSSETQLQKGENVKF